MKKAHYLLLISLLLVSFSLSTKAFAFFDAEKPILVAKREIVIPEKAKVKSLCKEVLTELLSMQKTSLGFVKTVRKAKLTAANDNELENKKAQNEVRLAKEKANKLMQLYKPEEAKPIIDAYNAGVDAALTVREKAFSAALKAYRTELDKQLGIISRQYSETQKKLKKIVCTGRRAEDTALARAYSRGEGLVAGRLDFGRSINNELRMLRFVVRAANNSAYKTSLRDTEKTRDDALKPLKKIK